MLQSALSPRAPRQPALILSLAFGLLCFVLNLVEPAFADETTSEPNAKLIVLLNITDAEARSHSFVFNNLHKKIIESFPASNNDDLICYLFSPPKPTDRKLNDYIAGKPCPDSSNMQYIAQKLDPFPLISSATERDEKVKNIFDSKFPGKYKRVLLVHISVNPDNSFKINYLFFRQATPEIPLNTGEQPIIACVLSHPIASGACDRMLKDLLALHDPRVNLPSSKYKILINEKQIEEKISISKPEGTYTARWASRLFEKNEDKFTILYGMGHQLKLNEPRVSSHAKAGFVLIGGAAAMLASGVSLLSTSCETGPNSETTYRCISRNKAMDTGGWSLAGVGTALSIVGAVLLGAP